MSVALLVILLVAVFAAMLGLIFLKCPVGAALMAGAVLLGLAMRMPLNELLATILRTSSAPRTLALAGCMALIVVISSLMEKSGQLSAVSANAAAAVGMPRFSMGLPTAAIGLLPMPGGTLVSAPLVDAAAGSSGVSAEQKAAVNYWFRHVWEYCWPMYPGLLLASSITGVRLELLCAAQIPLTIVAIFAGVVFLLPKNVRRTARLAAWARIRSLGIVLFNLWPLVMMMGAFLFLGMPFLATLACVSLFLAAYCVVLRKCRGRDLIAVFAVNRHVWGVLAIALGVELFSACVVGSGASHRLAGAISAASLPVPVIQALLPAVLGLLSGATPAFVGAAFPVLFGGAASVSPHALVLAYSFGFVGVLLSPVHVCFIVSNAYFKARAAPVYAKLLLPGLLMLAAAAGLYMLYRPAS
jgi:integral membrane protein (TIGR00529 family)